MKDLFRGFEWARILVVNRNTLGAILFNYSQNTGSQIIKPLGKTLLKQQKYVKL